MRLAATVLSLAFPSVLLAQDEPVPLWPPRDVGLRESFGAFTYAHDGGVLAVQSDREASNPFVRVYLREGLNWIEDERLTLAPLTPPDQALSRFASIMTVDQGRVLTGRAGTQLFERVRTREWKRTDIPDPDPDVGVDWGRALGLSGDGMAVADEEAVWTLQEQAGQWLPVQRFPAQVGTIELDGDDLVLSERDRVRVLHRTGGGTFTEGVRHHRLHGFRRDRAGPRHPRRRSGNAPLDLGALGRG